VPREGPLERYVGQLLHAAHAVHAAVRVAGGGKRLCVRGVPTKCNTKSRKQNVGGEEGLSSERPRLSNHRAC